VSSPKKTCHPARLFRTQPLPLHRECQTHPPTVENAANLAHRVNDEGRVTKSNLVVESLSHTSLPGKNRLRKMKTHPLVAGKGRGKTIRKMKTTGIRKEARTAKALLSEYMILIPLSRIELISLFSSAVEVMIHPLFIEGTGDRKARFSGGA
jgi:hypothetical protein